MGCICAWSAGDEQNPKLWGGHVGCWLSLVQVWGTELYSYYIQLCCERSKQPGLLQAPLSTRTLKASLSQSMSTLVHSRTLLPHSMMLLPHNTTLLPPSKTHLPQSMSTLPQSMTHLPPKMTFFLRSMTHPYHKSSLPHSMSTLFQNHCTWFSTARPPCPIAWPSGPHCMV